VRSPKAAGPKDPAGIMAKRSDKGTFSDTRLGVAKRYVFPWTRRPILLAGLVLAVPALILLGLDVFARGGRLLSNGPLSSNHANLAQDCTTCHNAPSSLSLAGAGSVTDDNCKVCHEKRGDRQGVYTFASHYLYRTRDFERVSTSENEVGCIECHAEHMGRDAAITVVSDHQCLPCHEYGSFNEGHPEFDFVASQIADLSSLRFPHIRHVADVMNRQALTDVEQACLYCHNPEPDGRNFRRLSFDQQCAACHLQRGTATTALPRRKKSEPLKAGVWTLDELRDRHPPGSGWASRTDPRDFITDGSTVTKISLEHRDPWILTNLRGLRSLVYPDVELADLVAGSPDVPAEQLSELYAEAAGTLQSYSDELKSRPEAKVHADLRRIDQLLAKVRGELKDPYASLDATRFRLAFQNENSEINAEQKAELLQVANDLTATCQQCHVLDPNTLTMTWVPKDQRALKRADFSHRAHILQRRCLDCHARIPITENLDVLGGDNGEERRVVARTVSAEIDRSSIQNLPAVGTCQECHAADKSNNRCITCHSFHPSKSKRSDLLLYVDR
jgi:hypothetical protein